MSQTILNTAVIKMKSEELQIPFANLALAFVTEEFLVHIAESEFAPYLWIKNPERFRLDYYKRKMADNPGFYYQKNPAIKDNAGKIPGQKIDFELVELMMQTFCKSGMKNIEWEYGISEAAGSYRVDINALMENIRVPFQIMIEELDNEKLFPYEVTFRLCIRNNYRLKLNSYPSEYTVADCIFEILEKLELINDMNNYQKVYSILKKQALDGRKVQLQLSRKCEKNGLKVNQQRLSLLLGYKKYVYMKKKWKSYLKNENKKSPEWEEIMELLESFLTPIWEMMCSDMIFLGDWTPELSRFLE